MIESRISGADEPRAISVRLAIVAFQIWAVTGLAPLLVCTIFVDVCEVMYSIATCAARRTRVITRERARGTYGWRRNRRRGIRGVE